MQNNCLACICLLIVAESVDASADSSQRSGTDGVSIEMSVF